MDITNQAIDEWKECSQTFLRETLIDLLMEKGDIEVKSREEFPIETLKRLADQNLGFDVTIERTVYKELYQSIEVRLDGMVYAELTGKFHEVGPSGLQLDGIFDVKRKTGD